MNNLKGMTLFNFYQEELIKVAQEITKLESELDKERDMPVDHEDNIKIMKMYNSKSYYTSPIDDNFIFVIDNKAIVVCHESLQNIISSVENEEYSYANSILSKQLELVGLEAKAKYLVDKLSGVKRN